MAPRSTPTRSKGATATATKRGAARKVAQEADEYVEVSGGGDFPPVWDFEDQGDLVGTFLGTDIINAKGKDRTLHSFEVDGETVNVWGTAILDSRLADVDDGSRVKVVKTGDKVPTKSGHQAWEFKVFVARGALSRGR